jgi:hypothetical protein
MSSVTAFVSLLVLVAAVPSGAQALKPSTRIVAQPSAPIAITSYNAEYRERSQYTSPGIHHSTRFASKAGKEIVALQIGLVSFNVWNEFIDRTLGVTIENLAPGKEGRGTWVANAYGEFAFLTGVAYVNRVRFADGEIWTANLDDIVEELRKIEKNFDVANLKKPEGPTQ